MFQVNRKDVGNRYIETEGDHRVTLTKVEESLDAKGREVCKLTFKTDDGASLWDRFINQENVWFRVNQLVVATKHSVPDGTQVDFLGVKGSYANFLKSMIGLELVITTRFEEYHGNGETKRMLRVRSLKEVAKAPVYVESDESPF